MFNTKCELMRVLWDRTLFKLLWKSQQYSDQGMLQILSLIKEVPKFVHDEIIKMYCFKVK